MSRDALVIGINSYQFPGLHNLQAPAVDAEAIAKMLKEYGDFNVWRLPEAIRKEDLKPYVGANLNVTLARLQDDLVRLFKPEGRSIPDTALFYFSGHGLRQTLGIQEGFLATSDANPDTRFYGLSLQWLRRLLQESPIKQQIVWLDCCHSGELLNFNEADPGVQGNGRDRCFIAASREFEVAYQDLSDRYSLLTKVLLDGLDPRKEPQRWVTNHSLTDYINHYLREATQRPTCSNFGEPINLTRTWEVFPQETTQDTASAICPYKGLEYFDCNEEDPKYFYGREELIDRLLDNLRQSNFLAIVGASGSGKSSVVRAGVIHQLQLGRRLPGSEQWQIYIMVPGDRPLQNLAAVFVEPNLSRLERAERLGRAEGLLREGADGLRRLVQSPQFQRVVLVVDQFEEVFTLCQDENERQQFINCLLGALGQVEDKLCLIIAMRADFFSKCIEQGYSGLANRINNSLVLIPPMNQEQLRQAIVKPAERVDLEIEPELVQEMLRDVEGSPGSLPLLQYTLKELWQRRSNNCLKLVTYSHLGRISGTLNQRATEIFNQLPPEQKEVAKYIFLCLTQLGEGTEDTRRRVLKRDLITAAKHAESLVEEVVNELADKKNRLIVTSESVEEGLGTEPVTVVDVAHEALIRYWHLLRQWLDDNRDILKKQRRIERDAEDWHNSDKSQDYLLQGLKLTEAERCFQGSDNNISPTKLAKHFVQESIKHREKSIKQKKFIRRTVFIVIFLFAIIAFWQANLAIKGEVLALTSSSENSFIANDQIGALMASLKASKQFDRAIGLQPNDRDKTVKALQQAVEGLQERNRLEGHDNWVYGISFSPDKQTIATASADKKIRLWNLDGKNIEPSIEGKDWFYDVSFSPNGKTFTAASKDGTVNLWTVGSNKKPRLIVEHPARVNSVSFSPDGKLIAIASSDRTVTLQTLDNSKKPVVLRGHTDEVFDISFSPIDKNLIATASADRTAKLWKLDNQCIETFASADDEFWKRDSKCIQTLKGHEDKVYRISFSPNSETLATASWDKTAIIWSLKGKPITTLRGHTDRVVDVSFSPDNKTIATASWDRTVKVWTAGGGFLETLKGHSDRVLSVSFSLDNQIIASASADKTVKFWRHDSTLLPILQDHTGPVRSVSFSPDGKILATASDDKTVKIWDLTGKKNPIKLKHDSGVHSVSFSVDGKLIATASADKTAKLWNLDGQCHKTLHHVDEVFDVSFSPDGKLIATASADKIARLWNLNGGRIKTFKGHNDRVVDVSFSPDGKTLATASDDKTPRLWSVDSGQQLKVLKGHDDEVNGISFSPDGKLIATASDDKTIRLWNLDGKEIKKLEGHNERVLGVTFSPDGKKLASASFDKTVKLWEMSNPGYGKLDVKLLQTFKGHDDWVWNVSFDKDGKTLASASSDRTVRRWKMDSQKTQSSKLDDLEKLGCENLRNYLKTNIKVSPEDRHLCDRI